MKALQPARQIAPGLDLREYQNRIGTEIAINYGAGVMAQMLYSPTGSGKTVTALGIIKRIWASGAVLPHGTRPYFIVERLTLCWQAVEAFERYGLTVSVIQGANSYTKPDADVVVAMTQTLKARHGVDADGKHRELPRDLGMAIIDEAHLLHSIHKEFIERLDATLFVGMSATPLRHELGRYYKALVKGPSMRDCIEAGWLVPPRIFMPTELDLSSLATRGNDYKEAEATELMRTIHGDIASNWKQHAHGRKTLVFCVGIPHAQELAQDFRSEGIRAEALHCNLSDDESAEIKQLFVDGEIDVLCSVMMLSTGFDCPAADCAVLARPTLSESLHYQQLGRVLRPHEGKDHALVLDHAGNFARFGDPLEFEVHTLDEGELRTREKQKKADRVEAVQCLECHAAMFAGQVECPECGHKRERPVLVNVVPGVLGEVAINTNTPEGQAQAAELARECDEEVFYRMALGFVRERGHSDGRAYHLWRERFKQPEGAKCRFLRTELEPSQAWRRWYRNHMAQRKIAENARRKKAEQAEQTLRKPIGPKGCTDHPEAGVGLYRQDAGPAGDQYRMRCNACLRATSNALPHDQVDTRKAREYKPTRRA